MTRGQAKGILRGIAYEDCGVATWAVMGFMSECGELKELGYLIEIDHNTDQNSYALTDKAWALLDEDGGAA